MKDLTSEILGSTKGQVTVNGVHFDSVEVERVTPVYSITDDDLAVILGSLKTLAQSGLIGADNFKVLVDVSARLISQVR